MNNDIRNLQKWLNEEQEAPIDRQALARVLAMAQQPAQQEHFDHKAAANAALRDAQNRSYQVAKSTQPAQQFTEDAPADCKRLAEHGAPICGRCHMGPCKYTTPQAQPAQQLPFGVGGGLVAIKTLLSRDPCAHAKVAIEMIDAMLSEQPAQQQEPSHSDTQLAEQIMSDCGCSTNNQRLLERITERLAKHRPAHQQEPTIAACIIGADSVGKKIDGHEAAKVYAAMQKAMRFETAAPQPAQPQQEPVAFSQFLSDVVTAAGLLSGGKTDKSLAARISEFAFRLRTSPPAQRKPLTDEEIHQCFLASEQGQDGTEFRKAFARAIEAAHGIKENT